MFYSETPVAIFIPSSRRYYVLHDREGDIWLFLEQLTNGWYPRYTLTGETLSKGVRHRASLDCNFKCDHSNNRLSVGIEDILTTKHGRHLGAWMLNRLISMVRRVGVDEIYGEYKPREDLKLQGFFSRFGFRRRLLPSGRERIMCPTEELHMAAIADLKELDFPEVIRDWHAARFGGEG